MLAKINIVNKFILTPKELEVISQEITQQGLDIHNLDDASDYLTTTVFYKDTTLIISINIPRLLPTQYQKVGIEPLPLFNRTVNLAHQTVFINHEQILAINSKCRETNKITICERKQLVEISDDPCEAPLLRGKHGQCKLSEYPPSIEIRTIAPGMLLVITVHHDVTLNSTCGISTRTLTGIHLVTFHNCSLYVKNELYENYELWFHQPTIFPLQSIKIKPLQISRHVNLSALHQFNLQNRKYLETVELKHRIGFATISTVIILMIALCVFGLLKYRPLSKPEHCSGRAILTGGAVKRGTTPLPPNDNRVTPAQPEHRCTETAKSAGTKLNTMGNIGSSIIDTTADNVTSGASLLGARLAVLGNK